MIDVELFIQAVWGVQELYNHREPRFEGVFTKLQVLGLTEYEKILLLDIDTLVVESMDGLFELPAPAAMGPAALLVPPASAPTGSSNWHHVNSAE